MRLIISKVLSDFKELGSRGRTEGLAQPGWLAVLQSEQFDFAPRPNDGVGRVVTTHQHLQLLTAAAWEGWSTAVR